MPLYEYQCDACGQRFEIIQKFSDSPADICTKCGKGPVHRLLSSPAIQFKGSGWYITDYAQKGKPGSDGKGAATGESSEKTAAGEKTNGKSESKSDAGAAASSTSAAAKS